MTRAEQLVSYEKRNYSRRNIDYAHIHEKTLYALFKIKMKFTDYAHIYKKRLYALFKIKMKFTDYAHIYKETLYALFKIKNEIHRLCAHTQENIVRIVQDKKRNSQTMRT